MLNSINTNALSNFATEQITNAIKAQAKEVLLPEVAENLKTIWSILEDPTPEKAALVRNAFLKDLTRITNTRYESGWDEYVQIQCEDLRTKLQSGEALEGHNYNFFLADLKSSRAVLETIGETLYDFDDLDIPAIGNVEDEELTAEQELNLMRLQDLACGSGPCDCERHQFTEEDRRIQEKNANDPELRALGLLDDFDFEICETISEEDFDAIFQRKDENCPEIPEFEDEDYACMDPTLSQHWKACPRNSEIQIEAIEELLENVVITRLLYNENAPQEIYGLKGYTHEQAKDLVNRLGPEIADILEGGYFTEPVIILNNNEIVEEIEYR